VDWPAVNRICAQQSLLVENWTLRILELNADESRLRFAVTGSRTGPDGGGVSTERFVSKSGRVVIEPEDWTFARSFGLRHEPTPPERWLAHSAIRDYSIFPNSGFGISDCL
jgi:hypothetical protein